MLGTAGHKAGQEVLGTPQLSPAAFGGSRQAAGWALPLGPGLLPAESQPPLWDSERGKKPGSYEKGKSFIPAAGGVQRPACPSWPAWCPL